MTRDLSKIAEDGRNSTPIFRFLRKFCDASRRSEELERAARLLESMFIDLDVILAPAAPGEAPAGLDRFGGGGLSCGGKLRRVV